MGSNKKIEELDAEIKAMEEKIYGKPEEGSESNAKDGEPAESVADQSATTTQNVQTKELPDATSDPTLGNTGREQPAKRVNWKKRFKNMKQHHDTQIHEYRLKVSSLLSQITELQRENLDLKGKLMELTAEKGPSVKDLVTEDELNILGEEGISSIDKITKKAVEQATAPLKQELTAMQKEQIKKRKEETKRLAQESYNHFLSNLSRLVPDYDEIDVDPRFEEFLKKPDPASGRLRLDLFKTAEANGDVGRVAYFFNEFKKSLAPKQDKLKEKVTPVGSQSSPYDVKGTSPSGEVKYLRMADYDKFMRDITKGKYKHRKAEADAIEAEFDKAIAEGRLIP